MTISVFPSKFICLFLLISCLQSAAYSQQVTLLSIDELNKRTATGKDTTYIINFWATWCAPCVKELQYFEKLGADLKAEKLKVLLVNVDFKSKLKSTVIPFVKRRKLKSEVYLLNETDPDVYINRIDKTWTGSIPATLFMKNGKRVFSENEYNYKQLLNAYKNIQ